MAADNPETLKDKERLADGFRIWFAGTFPEYSEATDQHIYTIAAAAWYAGSSAAFDVVLDRIQAHIDRRKVSDG